MTQEDKELLLKDLCARLPYDVKVWVKTHHGQIIESDFLTLCNGGGYYSTLSYEGILNDSVVKPYLRPMDSMTEEEAKELSILCDIKDILSIKITDKYVVFEVDDGVCSIETKTIWYNEIVSSIEIFDWLNKNHFDYRNLIPMDLAIAVTKENNPYK